MQLKLRLGPAFDDNFRHDLITMYDIHEADYDENSQYRGSLHPGFRLRV